MPAGFDELIRALDSGRYDWISAPTLTGDVTAFVAGGHKESQPFEFRLTDERQTKLLAAVERNNIRLPQPSEGA